MLLHSARIPSNIVLGSCTPTAPDPAGINWCTTHRTATQATQPHRIVTPTTQPRLGLYSDIIHYLVHLANQKCTLNSEQVTALE